MFQFGPWWWNILGSPISFSPLLVVISYGLLFYAFHTCPCLLVFWFFFFLLDFFSPERFLLYYGFFSTCSFSTSLLFSPFKSYCSPITPFSFCFFLFHSLVVMSGYLLAAACLLDSFSWILFVPSTYVYMCLLNRKVLFVCFFPTTLNPLGCWSKCSPLFSPWVECVLWVFLHKVGLSHCGPTAF